MLLADVTRLKPEEGVLTLLTHSYLPGLATPAAIEYGVWTKSDNDSQQYGGFTED